MDPPQATLQSRRPYDIMHIMMVTRAAPERYCSSAEVCRLAGVSRATLYRRIASGRLPRPVGRRRRSLFDRVAVHRALADDLQPKSMRGSAASATTDVRLDFAPDTLRPFLRVSRREDGSHDVRFEAPEAQRPADWPVSIILPEVGNKHRSLRDPKFTAEIIKDASRLHRDWGAAVQLTTDISRGDNVRRDLPSLAELYFQSHQYKKLGHARRHKNRSLVRVLLDQSESRGHPLWEDVTPTILSQWLSRWETSATWMEYRTMLTCLGRHAVEAGWRSDNPARGFSWERDEPEEQNLWELEDVERYEAGCSTLGLHALGAMIRFMWLYGQRRGDLVGLQWDVHLKGSNLLLSHCKTRAKVSFPIGKTMRQRLEGLRQPGTNYVFVNPHTGRPYTNPELFRSFSAVRRLVDRDDDPKLVMKQLRHSFVCRLYRAGVSAMEIASITGHKLIYVHKIHEFYIQRSHAHSRSALLKDHAAGNGSPEEYDESSDTRGDAGRLGPTLRLRPLDPDEDQGIIAVLVGRKAL